MRINERYYFSGDIGGTTCKLGIFNGELEQLHKWSIKTDTSDHTGKTLLKNIYDSFNETLSTHQLKLMMSLALELVYQGLLILKLALLMGQLICIGQVV